MRSHTAFLFLSLHALILFSGCLRKSSTPASELRYPLETDIETLDTAANHSPSARLVLANLHEGLTVYNEQFEIMPGLAEKWEISQDGRAYTFFLRDTRWSDGIPVRAHDFHYAWMRVLDPENPSPHEALLSDVENAESLKGPKPSLPQQIGIKVLDDRRLEVRLKSPASDFLARLSMPPLAPARQDMIEARPNDHAVPPQLRSCGPYQLIEWVPTKRLRLVRNPYYYGPRAQVGSIEFTFLTDPYEILRRYEENLFDVASMLPRDQLEKLKARADYHKTPSLEMHYVALNSRIKPFDNKEARRAFALATSRKEVVSLERETRLPARAWIPEGIFAFERHVGLELNPAMGKSYLDHAGFKEPSLFPPLLFAMDPDELKKTAAQKLQAHWKTVLGLPRINLVPVEQTNLHTVISQTIPHLWLASFSAPYPDPRPFLQFLAFDTEKNHLGFKSAALEALTTAAARSVETKDRLELYRKAQRLLLEEEAAIIPLYQAVRVYLARPHLENFKIDAMGIVRFSAVKINEDALEREK